MLDCNSFDDLNQVTVGNIRYIDAVILFYEGIGLVKFFWIEKIIRQADLIRDKEHSTSIAKILQEPIHLSEVAIRPKQYRFILV